MPAHAHLAGRAREEPALEVAGLLRDHLDAVLRAPMSREQHAAVRALLRCRTAQLGGHLDTCTACGFARHSYNSCRDRHCPKCQRLAQARWVRARMRRVLGPTTFMSCSRCRRSCAHSPAQQQPTRCSSWVAIRNGSALPRTWASRRRFTPGPASSPSTPTCTASSPEAALLTMATAGSRLRVSSCPCARPRSPLSRQGARRTCARSSRRQAPTRCRGPRPRRSSSH
jgi:hypothetical protein